MTVNLLIRILHILTYNSAQLWESVTDVTMSDQVTILINMITGIHKDLTDDF
jgi:hypothetical protein